MHEPWSYPLYVAYVYPGWHRDAFRPAIDEWQLLDRFRPYFDGHQPPARPLDGRYDDSNAQTARRQLRQAAAAGITAFSYFMYFSDGEFLLHEPLRVTLREAGAQPVRIATTWCIRLPHRSLPVTERGGSAEGPLPPADLGDLAIADAAALLAPDELALVSVFVPQVQRRNGCEPATQKRWSDRLYAQRAETGRPVALKELVTLLERLRDGGNWARVLRDAVTRDTVGHLSAGQLERLLGLARAHEIASITFRQLEAALELCGGLAAQQKEEGDGLRRR
jgi:hypothetical protein